jgi:hypothetical protein
MVIVRIISERRKLAEGAKQQKEMRVAQMRRLHAAGH